jgi:hypothetical protein
MDKKPLIVVSICAVVLLILGSLSNVVGYQQVQSSNQQIIKEEVNPKELLFQTIVDIANNKEIQRIILKSQISRGISPTSEIPVLTKSQLKQMYILGLLLSRFISNRRMQSMIGKYQFSNQEARKEITTAIEKDSKLNGEMAQLSKLKCDCGNDNATSWNFPVICQILYVLTTGIEELAHNLYSHDIIYFVLTMIDQIIIWGLGEPLQCWWFHPYLTL